MLNFVIAMQVIEIMGILRNGVCGSARSNELMDPQFTDYFPSETDGAESESESEDGHISRFFNNFRSEFCFFSVSGTEIPCFNHQSVENNSILFWVGRKFPKLAVYIAYGADEAYDKNYFGTLYCFFYISINGCKKRECQFDSLRDANNRLLLYSPPQSFLQQKLNESNPTNQNLVEVTYKIQFRRYNGSYIKPPNPTRWGVQVECICPPQESKSYKVWGPRIPNLPLLTAGHDDVDYWSELPFYGSDDLEAEEEEYQSPLVLNDTSRSCMSWLVGPTTMLFKLFCFCCPRDF